MNVEIIYPQPGKRRLAKQRLALCCQWGFLFAGFICAAVNIATGGRAWSVVVIWAMWMAWAQIVSPDAVEYNRISQTIKLIVNACILLCLIDWLLTPGWAAEVVPIVGFSTLILVSLLFFTDFTKQRQNMYPMLRFCAVCLIGSIIGLVVMHGEENWPFVVLCALGTSLLVGCVAKLGKGFLNECRKRFCAK